MRTPTRIGIAGLSVAALGWGAALGFMAPSANAASSVAGSASYDSKASATMGGASVPDVPNSALSVTAIAQPGSSNSPQLAGLGADKVLPTLKSAPGLGAALASALRAANPGSAQLAEVKATAAHSGTSTACATVLSADCAPGRAKPLVLRLGLPGLTSALGASALSLPSVTRQLPDPLADYSVVLTIDGPRATCSAGPAGSGQFRSASTVAGATVDLQDKGKSVLPAGATPLTGGSVFTSLLSAARNSPLNAVLSAVSSATPLTVTLSPGSHTASGSAATATTGQVGLASGTVNLLDVRSATVTCGANTPDADPYNPSGVDKPVAGTGSFNAPSGLSSEVPALQSLTDEGQPLGPSMDVLPTLYTPLS